MITENLSTLKIHKLSQAQYDRELANGTLDDNALYLTPDEEVDLSNYATKDDLNTKSDNGHNHDDVYYTETEVDDKLDVIDTDIIKIIHGNTRVGEASYALDAGTAMKATQDASGNVITDTYEIKTDATAKLNEAKEYTDTSCATIDTKLSRVAYISTNESENVSYVGVAAANYPLAGKKLSIVGDSISTFNNHIPSGYATWYPTGDVVSVDDTWWKILLDKTRMTLCKNASWSGSTLCGNTTDTSGIVGCSDARVDAIGGSDTPDIIIVFIGINDFAKANGHSCGSYDGTSPVSSNTTISSITDAYGVLLSKIRQRYPNAIVFGCRIMPEQYTGSTSMSASYANGFPNINPTDSTSLTALNDSIEKICKAFGCGVIPMDACGISFYNVSSYTLDGLHPNANTMRKMAKVAEEWLNKYAVSVFTETNGEASHTHSYTSQITTEPTCITTGIRTYTCECGHSYTESVSATGHNYVNGACVICGVTDPNDGWDSVTYTEIDGFYNSIGVLEQYNGVYNTGLVAVNGATQVRYTQSNTKNHYLDFFDADQNFISFQRTNTAITHTFDIPTNAVYFSVAYYEQERDTINVQVYVA